jgi:hypothetical protein
MKLLMSATDEQPDIEQDADSRARKEVITSKNLFFIRCVHSIVILQLVDVLIDIVLD